VARILVFALIAAAAVLGVAALLRRRSSSGLDYDVYPPYPDSELDYDTSYSDDDDGYGATEDVYPPFAARTYN
jgi:hypothetical protein